MPQRPESHEIGDIAVNRVMGVCLSAGWACERVAADYGEDICAQTVYQNKVDPYRVFFQVKGTKSLDEFRRTGNKLTVTVSKDHALRWIRSPDPMVLVLWDVTNDSGYYAIPGYQLTEYDLFFSTSKTVQLVLDEGSRFDQPAATQLAWELRISFYTHLLSEARFQDAMVKKNAPADVQATHKSRVPLIAFDFLRLVGVVQSLDDTRQRIDPDFISYYRASIALLQAHHTGSELTNADVRRIVRQSIIVAFMNKVNNGKSALPESLISECLLGAIAAMQAGGNLPRIDMFDENAELNLPADAEDRAAEG